MTRHVLKLPSGEAFSPDKTFNCGQCFRFDETDDGWQGIVGQDVVLFPKKQPQGEIEYYSVNGTDLSDFLDLETRYADVNRTFDIFPDSVSGIIKNAVEISSGLRILKQDFFETLISFIISQNNNIPRIKKNVATICARYGERIPNTDFYAFPTPESLLEAGENGLADCRLGFRVKYILDACRRVVDGEISRDTTKEALQTIHGVGPKVASCVLLYGLHRLDEVPVDVWMKKVFLKYFETEQVDLGEFGGILQQYLFFRERFIIEGKKI